MQPGEQKERLPSTVVADDEAKLVAGAKSGDATSFTELVRRYERKIFRLANNITQNREDAEDAMQEPLAGEVNERRAAALIGLSSADLRSLAREAALGKSSEASSELIFTFEELRRLCLLAHSAHL